MVTQEVVVKMKWDSLTDKSVCTRDTTRGGQFNVIHV